ncbi:SH3 domain-containing protein [Rhizobium miluonense]|uniref:SH3 domain-containing protein n=1 Tax=Rhizobium miluonense TaxID=411945 RepID=UPI001FD9B3F2|nr:SH3 domain-containing protein [Rhizobium miluonense]
MKFILFHWGVSVVGAFQIGCAFVLGVTFFASDAAARLSYSNLVTDDGRRYVIVNGSFEADDDLSKFRKAVNSYRANSVTFDSPGGNVQKAIELGRLIRSLGLSTVAVRVQECASACSLAFLGGVVRLADAGSIGVHKTSFSDTKGMRVEEAVAAVQTITADVISYMTDMGADPGLLKLSLQYDSDDMRYLSASEMKLYRVTTPDADEPITESQAPESKSPDLQIPVAQSGIVQHLKGTAPLKANASANSKTIADFANGSGLDIKASDGEWYQVSIAGQRGYMHQAWVWVREFEERQFGKSYIQIKSVDDLETARSFVLDSKIPLAVHLTANGRFAVTVNATGSRDIQSSLLQILSTNNTIPKSAFVTYGNTYVREVCCGDLLSSK